MSANATAPGIGESRKGEKAMGTARNHRLLVGGKWVRDKETMKDIDKYSGETIGAGPAASKKTVEKAIGAGQGGTIPRDASVAGEWRVGFSLRCAVGVVAAITPFNFPLNLVAHKVGPALAAGCTLVLNPASTTPLTAIRLGEMLEGAGLPPGVLNVVVGPGGTVGEWMTTDPRIAKISFTGSPPGGEAVIRKAGPEKITKGLG